MARRGGCESWGWVCGEGLGGVREVLVEAGGGCGVGWDWGWGSGSGCESASAEAEAVVVR